MIAILALTSFLSFCLLIALIKIFHELWSAPNRLQRLMGSQGIKGPPYRFIHGSTKEIRSLQKEAMSKPFGLSHDIFPKLQPHFHHWTNLYGRCYLQWNGSQAELVVAEPELIKEILNDRERVYPKPQAPAFVKKILGDSLGMCHGQKWEKLRRLANHAFLTENLKSMIPSMIASAEAMVERWKGHVGKEIDVYEEFRIFTSEVIAKTAFGSSYLEGKAIFEMLVNLASIVSRNVEERTFPGLRILKSSDEVESERLEKEIRDSVAKIIKKREENVANGEEESYGDDFLGVLLRAQHDTDEKRRISADEVVDECKTFYFSGQETSNSLITWTVFLLAVHADWQDKARKEVLELFGKQNPKPDGVSKLKFMSMIINESLRLYPPVVGLSRRVERKVRLGDIDLPANLVLQIPILAVHHDPQIWGDDAHLFKPERFAEGVAKATKDNFAAFLPFGMGHRICVGFNFAIIEAKLALAMILQRYTIALSPAYVHAPVQLLTSRPQHGLQVILNPC